jgi:hypothetical protein
MAETTGQSIHLLSVQQAEFWFKQHEMKLVEQTVQRSYWICLVTEPGMLYVLLYSIYGIRPDSYSA